MSYDYDLFVIGGGSGGVRAARKVAGIGKRVGIAEKSRYGGTCVIRGCVPKKLLVYASNFGEAFEDAKGYGWTVGEPSFDWATLRENKEAEVTRLEGLYRKGLDTSGADIFDTRAILRSRNEIYLEDLDRTVTAERIILAVGGYPNPHKSLEGHEHCITSDDAFDLPEFPKKIVIAGAGYIAIEFAGIFAGLGADVTIVYRGQDILSGFDMELRRLLHTSYENRGIRIVTQTVFDRIEKLKDGRRRAVLSTGEEIVADQVMLALGRLPSTEGIGLETAGVETNDKGKIVVNAYKRTTADNIWALGDVDEGSPELTPVAIHEAMTFFSTEYQGKPEKPDYDTIATAVFSHPEIGTVGLTEEQASETFAEVKVFKAVFRPMKHTLSGRSDRTLVKLLVNGEDDVVVGAHVLGPEAGEFAQLMAIPLKMRATKADFDRTMAVHPTAAEELVTMYEPTYVLREGARLDEAA